MQRAFSLTALVLVLTAAVQPVADGDPRAIVVAATAAVRDGSEAGLRSRWQSAAERGDRDALLGLATIERLTYEYGPAERHYRQLFTPDGEPDAHDIQARIGLGMALEAQGEGGDRVETLYRQALEGARRVGDSTDVGEALFRLGSLLLPLGGNAAGPAYLDSAVQALPPSAEALRATARCRRTQYFVVTVRPGADDSLTAAMAAARSSGDPDALGYCLRAASVRHQHNQAADSATAAELEMIALRRRIRDRSGLSVALMVHADHLRGQGRYGESIRLIEEALEEARASKNRYIESTVAVGLGGMALVMNDHAAAGEHIEAAIASFEASDDSSSLMLAKSYRPFISMASGDLDRARQQTLPLIDYWRRLGDYEHLADLFRQLASIEMRDGNEAAAERALDSAMATAQRIGSQRGGVYFDRARLALRRGQLDRAERDFRSYLALLDTNEQLPRYEGRVRLAEVFARRGELARAERELAEASDDLDAWRASLDDAKIRTLAFQASAFEANDRNSSVAVVLAALANGGRAPAAFELAERRRARELAERMARSAALREGGENGRAGDASASSGMLAGPSRSAADIAQAIPDDSTAILEFVTAPAGAPSTLFVLTRALANRGGTVAFRIPQADSLVGAISRLLALIEAGEDPEALERQLAAGLLDTALAVLGPAVTTLVIVPDGPLHRMPWDVLRLPDGRYVAERYAVGIVPSAAIAAAMWSTAPSRDVPGEARVLAFGNPEFGEGETPVRGEEVYRSAIEATGGLPRLPHSAREARLVASYGAASELRVGEDATAAYLKRAPLAEYDVVHFATHALIDERVAARSVLALGAGDGESGFLGAPDLAALDLDAALVVLSACRSAGGVIVDGEGVQGLTAPLLQAGARSVVATTWRIGDRATVPIVDAFYDAMASGMSVAQALRAAKLDAIERGAPPREWAAFSLVGDPFMLVPLVEPSGWRRWMLVVAGLVILVAITIMISRRRGARTGITPVAR